MTRVFAVPPAPSRPQPTAELVLEEEEPEMTDQQRLSRDAQLGVQSKLRRAVMLTHAENIKKPTKNGHGRSRRRDGDTSPRAKPDSVSQAPGTTLPSLCCAPQCHTLMSTCRAHDSDGAGHMTPRLPHPRASPAPPSMGLPPKKARKRVKAALAASRVAVRAEPRLQASGPMLALIMSCHRRSLCLPSHLTCVCYASCRDTTGRVWHAARLVAPHQQDVEGWG